MKKAGEHVLEWAKHLIPVAMLAVVFLVAAGRLQAQVALMSKQVAEQHAVDVRQAQTDEQLLREVSEMKGYLKAIAERKTP